MTKGNLSSVRNAGTIALRGCTGPMPSILFDPAMPGIADVRLPDPLDLSLFDTRHFLHDGKVHAATAS